MKVRRHRGSLDDSMATVVEIEPTLPALIQWINEEHVGKPIEAKAIDLTPQGFDSRIGWNMYLITVKGLGVVGMADGPIGNLGISPGWGCFRMYAPDPVYPGKKLFELKATHGLPLDVAVERILVQEGRSIDWVGFIEQARSNGWYDFQTLEVVTQALEDAFVPRGTQSAILLRLKQYVTNNLLPF